MSSQHAGAAAGLGAETAWSQVEFDLGAEGHFEGGADGMQPVVGAWDTGAKRA